MMQIFLILTGLFISIKLIYQLEISDLPVEFTQFLEVQHLLYKL